MARILEIQLENVKSIVSGRARLTDGVNFIYGPNGAGKSSILDAIAFTLYGTDWLRRVKLRLADLVRVHAKTAIFRLKVQGVDGKIYIIQRAITPEMAVRLGKFCGNGPGIWLRMQVAHDLWFAKQSLSSDIDKIPTHHAA